MEHPASPTVDSRLGEQWLVQMQKMRAALEDLHMFQDKDMDPASVYPDYSPTTSFSSDGRELQSDIWDLVSDDGDEYSTEALSEDHLDEQNANYRGRQYDSAWLEKKCHDLAKTSSDIDYCELKEQVTSILKSDMMGEELQMFLADVLGYSELDLVSEILYHRSELLESLINPKTPPNALLSSLYTREQRDEALRLRDIEHKLTQLAKDSRKDSQVYPHVYKNPESGNSLSMSGAKYSLPTGSKRTDFEKYEEYSIPAVPVGTLTNGQRLVNITEMDSLCQRAFLGYRSLNRMQSLVYPVAYHTSENMLICAPTGAGKTDAAMLTILQTVAKNVVPDPLEAKGLTEFEVLTDNFKIIYVAPMKALAAEVTAKLSSRLSWLGIEVRELTGDMHLTKAEIVQTQIIVTTPEKWDVVTRKSTGDTELVRKVRLLIIDEVHMLHDERGAVLEAIVARTQRQVESTQSLIRIIGLSATLPNYVDVADFLKVNRMAGLFYFDASFRPVPLEQHFVGAKGKAGSKQSKENIEEVVFQKVRDMLQLGHQIMVFVHSRKDTFKTASHLYQKAIEGHCVDLFDPTGHPRYDQAYRDVKTSKARELRELLPKALGTHHAGMARTDRNLVERLFAEGVLKVLCCTATLAWGVNLPAAAVIIKGTQIYSAELGKLVDLGILDVLQIFGRAGRPQYQDSGIGFICTTYDKLQHYLSAVTHQQPIESKFSKRLVDNLNAEIALGTVTSIPEAVQWLGYSYLFVRMQRNPLQYGIDWSERSEDPQLVQRRRHLVIQAAHTLQQSQMIIFNEGTEELRSKDVGRIASQYYVLQTSVQIFNTMMRPRATEADALTMISMSGEFDNVQSRESEANELTKLKGESVSCEIKGGIETSHGKVNVLLQSYISRARIDDFTLFSDTAYVAQNSARICRSLFMTALNRRWGYQCLVLLSLCKAIERQVWPYQHPLHQFDLPQPVLKHLDEKGSIASIEALRDMESVEIGDLVRNKKMGHVISKILGNFPTLSIETEIAPLNRDVLRVRLLLAAEFNWNDRHHGTSELFWIWVENSESSEIYHHEQLLLSRKRSMEEHELTFTIPITDPVPSQIYVRAVSDRWLGAETVTAVSFQHLIRPDTESVYTDLLALQPIPVSALKNPILEEIYNRRFHFFNPMQSQVFHFMYHTSANVLLGSPTGSGKTVAAELAMWWAFREKPGSKVVYIAPMKALVRERVQDWQQRLAIPTGIKLVELTGDNTPDTRTIRDADIIITTPEKWDGISRSWQTRNYVQQVSLVIIDEIHLLGGDRGPILEIIVSRMNYIASQKKGSVRLVGMSTACANASDLGNWLGVKEGLFNFRHSVRPVPLEIFIDGFPEQRGFCPLMQSMNRPTFLAIKSHSPEKPVIVFVASRRQTRLTARDLVNFCGMEENPRRFLKMDEEDLTVVLSKIKDEALREALSFGIGLHHAGLVESDRELAEALFANNKIQILVATSTLAWGVNLPAHLVVVKGTQFFDAKTQGYKDMDLTDVLQMLGRAGRPQFDSSGIARIFTQDSKKPFYKHFLHTGFPVESSLHNVLDDHLAAEISAGTISSKQDALDYLTWTFFFRRIHKNPSFYGLELDSEDHDITAQEHANSFMIDLVEHSLSELEVSNCAEVCANGNIDPTPYGKIMSYYYLSHKTIRHLLNQASRDANFEEVLEWMAKATEYDDLPVRHNEDLINAELSKNLPVDASRLDLPLGDPHVKAFLLLQAHLSRVELPISDYVGDQISVLDQSIRIIQASIDVLAELGYHKSCLNMVKLLQCVKSARWPTDSPFSIFPGFDEDRINTLKGSTLKELCEYSSDNLGRVVTCLGIPNPHTAQFGKAVKTLPLLDISVSSIAVHNLTIEIKRRNQASADYRMYAPKFPKLQTEGFFVVLLNSTSHDLVALKRIAWSSQKNTSKPTASKSVVKATFKLPAHDDTMSLFVRVISDGYINMEWTTSQIEIPAPPSLDGMSKLHINA